MKHYVLVHIWGDNANVYADATAARLGLGDEIEDDAAIDFAIEQAIAQPGEPAYLDDGISTLRYLSIRGGER